MWKPETVPLFLSGYNRSVLWRKGRGQTRLYMTADSLWLFSASHSFCLWSFMQYNYLLADENTPIMIAVTAESGFREKTLEIQVSMQKE